MGDFVGFRVQRSRPLPVEVEDGVVLSLRHAILDVGDLQNGTRVMLQLISNTVPSAVPIATFLVGKCEDAKLDLRLTSSDEPRFSVSCPTENAEISVEILGCIDDIIFLLRLVKMFSIQ